MQNTICCPHRRERNGDIYHLEMGASVTVGTKALNESRNIARALDSPVAAVAPVAGTAILAGSGSSDDPVAIAQTFPVRIVKPLASIDLTAGR